MSVVTKPSTVMGTTTCCGVDTAPTVVVTMTEGWVTKTVVRDGGAADSILVTVDSGTVTRTVVVDGVIAPAMLVTTDAG